MERGASRGIRGMRGMRGMRGGMRGGHPPRDGRVKKKTPAKALAVPSRSLPRRAAANKKKGDSSDDNKPVTSSQTGGDQPSIVCLISFGIKIALVLIIAMQPLSPSKPATVNSKGGLTLRIPKPSGSPNGLEKRLAIGAASKLGPNKDKFDPLQMSLSQATTPPLESVPPMNGSSTNGSPRSSRSKRVKGLAPSSRTGLRSSRSVGPHSDTPASPPNGEVADGTILPPTDADTSNGTVHVSSILDLPPSEGLASPAPGLGDFFASGPWKSQSGSDMDLGL
jgi:hypothetical protein